MKLIEENKNYKHVDDKVIFTHLIKYLYDDEDEKLNHKKIMEKIGFSDTGLYRMIIKGSLSGPIAPEYSFAGAYEEIKTLSSNYLEDATCSLSRTNEEEF